MVCHRIAHFFCFFIAMLTFSVAHLYAFTEVRPDSNPSKNAYVSDLQARAEQLRLWEDRYWHLMMHYVPKWFAGVESEADGPGFFLSIKGKKNPRLELEATVARFFQTEPPPKGEQHPQCKFPARFRWLKEKLSIDSSRLPQPECNRLEAWKEAMSPYSITLIFASYYVNNPATLFGHTLLRFDKADPKRRPDLISYAVNYAAEMGPEPGPLYPILGMMGFYPGTFSMYPYYFKVQQYSNFQSRDIWEYKLTFTAEQIERVLHHLWELGSTHFDYYFFDENCSYHLLSLMEIADPSRNLRNRFAPFVAPSDTIKWVMDQEGWVQGSQYRPSKLSRFRQREAALTNDERRMLMVLLDEQKSMEDELFSELQGERKALMADAAIEYLSYEHEFPNHSEYQKQLLAERSRLGQAPEVENKPLSTPPHLSHDSRRVGVGGGMSSNDSFESIHLRLAYQDRMADETGLPPLADLEALRLQLRFYNDERKLHVEEGVFISVASLFPIDPYVKKISWNISGGWETLRVPECRRCNDAYVRGGVGTAKMTEFWNREVFYIFANGQFQLSPWSDILYRLGPEIRGGMLFDFSRWWRLGLEGQYDYSHLGHPRFNYGASVTQRFSLSRNSELRLSATKFRPSEELSLNVFLYF